MIIDFHTHTFPDSICEKTIQKLSMLSATRAFTNGSLTGLLESMKAAGIDYSVTLPVMTNPGQVEKVNASLMEQREELFARGIICFGGMHPDYPEPAKELKRLKEAGILGIKLHPAYQNVDFDDIRMLRIMDAASELGLVIITHAGIDIGISNHNYASTAHILRVLKEVAPKKLVLAHYGNWACWDDVERDLAGADVYFDTAFAIGPITPNPAAGHAPLRSENLDAEQFLRIARKHGTDKILFATDSPWEDQKNYLERIHAIPLTETEKKQILGENAKNLLSLES